MEDLQKTYFMLLGRPCLKQAKVYHEWGNNVLTIVMKDKIVTLSTSTKFFILISKCNLDDSYDWEHGLTNKNEKCHYQTIPNLWPIGKVSFNESKLLPYIFCGMTTIIYPIWFYHCELGNMLILDEFISV
jgi:hypothetical protein